MTDSTPNLPYAILGGGIGGLTFAIALQRKGIDFIVFEGAPQWKPLGAGIGLAGNAVKAFREIGLEEDMLLAGKALRQVVIMDREGKTIMQTDSEEVSKRYNVVNNFSIHRADLHELLLNRLPPEKVRLNKRCVDIVQMDGEVKLSFQDGSTVMANHVVAFDGIHSVARKKFSPQVQTRYAGYTCWRAVTTKLPAGLNPDVTSETWGPGKRFGIVPLTHNRLYWFACVNTSENNSSMQSLDPSGLMEYFKTFHAPIPEIIRNTPAENMIWNDIIDLPPLKQFAFGNIVLAGDAAHATTPNMGQGACMAIEDAVVLANAIGETRVGSEAFRIFEEKRISRTTRVVKDSWLLGKVAQAENPVLVQLRNWAFRRMPASATDRQFKFIYDVNLSGN